MADNEQILPGVNVPKEITSKKPVSSSGANKAIIQGADALQRRHNIRFGIEIEMFGLYNKGEFARLFNKYCHQFLLPVHISWNSKDWQVKGDASITPMSRDIGSDVIKGKLPFPKNKIFSRIDEPGYRKGEQQFIPFPQKDTDDSGGTSSRHNNNSHINDYEWEQEDMNEGLLQRKPSFKVGDENVKFVKQNQATDYELISPPLELTESNIKLVGLVVDILKRMRIKVNASTGVHVHISHNKMSMFNAVALVTSVDEKMIKKMWPGRFDTTYTHKKSGVLEEIDEYLYKLFDKYQDSDGIISNFKLNNAEDLGNSIHSRYFGINLEALNAHNTIEFRYAGAELKTERVTFWLKYIRRLVERSFAMKEINLENFTLHNDNGQLTIIKKYDEAELSSTSLIDNWLLVKSKSITDYIDKRFAVSAHPEGEARTTAKGRAGNAIIKEIRTYAKDYAKDVNVQDVGESIPELDGYIKFIKALINEKYFHSIEGALNIIGGIKDREVMTYALEQLLNSGTIKFEDVMHFIGDDEMEYSFDTFNKSPYFLLKYLNSNVYKDISLDTMIKIFNSVMVYENASTMGEIFKHFSPNERKEVLMNGISPFEFLCDLTKSFDNAETHFNIKLSLEDKASIVKKDIEAGNAAANETLKIKFIFLSDDAKKIAEKADVGHYFKEMSLNSARNLVDGLFDRGDYEKGGEVKYNKENLNLLLHYIKTEGDLDQDELESFQSKIKMFTTGIDFEFVMNSFKDDKDNLNISEGEARQIMDRSKEFGLFFYMIWNSITDDGSQKRIETTLTDRVVREHTIKNLTRYFKIQFNNTKTISSLFAELMHFIFTYKILELLKPEIFTHIHLTPDNIGQAIYKASAQSLNFENAKKFVDLLMNNLDNRKHITSYLANEFALSDDWDTDTSIKQYLHNKLVETGVDYVAFASRILGSIAEQNLGMDKYLKLFEIVDGTAGKTAEFIDPKALANAMKEVIDREGTNVFIPNITYDVIYHANNKRFRNGLAKLLPEIGIKQEDYPILNFTLNRDEDSLRRITAQIAKNFKSVEKEIIYLIENIGFSNSAFFNDAFKNISESVGMNFIFMVAKQSFFKNEDNHSIINKFANIMKKLDGVWGYKNGKKFVPIDRFIKLRIANEAIFKKYLEQYFNELDEMEATEFIQKNYDAMSAYDWFKKEMVNDITYEMVTVLKEHNVSFKYHFMNKSEQPDLDSKENDEDNSEKEYLKIDITFGKRKEKKITAIVEKTGYRSFISKAFIGSVPVYSKTMTGTYDLFAYNNIQLLEYVDDKELGRKMARMVGKIIDKYINSSYPREEKGEFDFKEKRNVDKSEQPELPFKEEDPDQLKLPFPESMDYNKRFKELLINEGMTKAKLFLMRNKNRIEDRKLLSIINRID